MRPVAHGAKQDVSLLADRFGIVAARLCDTQIAAALAGIAEQIGYGKLVAELVGVSLDKGPQFTDWSRRPLGKNQLRYAFDDVRYLLGAWHRLAAALEASGRLSWAFEESARMVASAAQRLPPGEAYRKVGGWKALKPAALGSLQRLAAWRERIALATNTPPSWLVPDAALVELSRRRARSDKDLRRARGISSQVVRDHGAAILAALDEGARQPLACDAEAAVALDPVGETWALAARALVQGIALAANLPPRTVASRGEVESLVQWYRDGADERSAASLLLLNGWRRELAGEAVLRWLRGDALLGCTAGGLEARALEIDS